MSQQFSEPRIAPHDFVSYECASHRKRAVCGTIQLDHVIQKKRAAQWRPAKIPALVSLLALCRRGDRFGNLVDGRSHICFHCLDRLLGGLGDLFIGVADIADRGLHDGDHAL